jgi:hypothetical protein
LIHFCGGGTSVVEAIALGRRGAGFDISSLAVFLSRAKTTPLSVHDRREITEWAKVIERLGMPSIDYCDPLVDEDKHYRKNLPGVARGFFTTVIDLARFLPRERQRRYVRLVLLGVGQWALDCKTQRRSWAAMRSQFCEQIYEVLADQYEFLGRVAKANGVPRCRLTETRRAPRPTVNSPQMVVDTPAGFCDDVTHIDDFTA